MFAVAIWDARAAPPRRSRATASGSSRSTTATTAASSSFASELDALPHGEIDLDALEAFLAFNSIPAPLSIFREIRKLPPGHTLDLGGRPRRRSSASRDPARCRRATTRTRPSSSRSAARGCATRCARTWSPTCRSACCSRAASTPARSRRSPPRSRRRPVRTFSIGFEEASFDELAGARAVAERYGTRHRELVLRPDAALLLPALAEAFDEPFADSSALPTYLVSKLAAEDVKVALSGEGGDELFGGYYTYVADQLAERVGPLATLARPLVDRLPTSTRRASFDYKAKRFARAAHLPPLERHHGWKEIFSADARAELTGRPSTFDPLVDATARASPRPRATSSLTRLQDVDFGLYLVDDLLTKTDRASMAWSLEARVPFMDTVVANFAFSLPVRHKVRGLSKKRLLRQGGRAAAAARGRARPQARLLDPGGRVAARRARAVRARDARAGDDPPAGLPAAAGGHARARRPRRRPRGPLAPALGPARVHALVRAPRRGRPPRRRRSRQCRRDEGLGRHDGERASARLPAARRAAARRRATRSRSPRATTRRRSS